MDALGNISKDYFDALASRAHESHVYRSYQLIGLELAQILHDASHKALYIKIAKDHKDHTRLLTLAKNIAERPGVKNKGAYFMRLLFNDDHAVRIPYGKKNSYDRP